MNPKDTKGFKTLLASGTLLLVGITGYFIFTRVPSPPIDISVQNDTANPMQLFSSAELGLSFKYPGGWRVSTTTLVDRHSQEHPEFLYKEITVSKLNYKLRILVTTDPAYGGGSTETTKIPSNAVSLTIDGHQAWRTNDPEPCGKPTRDMPSSEELCYIISFVDEQFVPDKHYLASYDLQLVKRGKRFLMSFVVSKPNNMRFQQLDSIASSIKLI